MAWRITESVVRGEIDNRQQGLVRGRLWLAGLAEPLELELAGNACPDLAGCRLQFQNPHPVVPLAEPEKFGGVQRGRIGELTASRKVRVLDVPVAEALAMGERGQKPPEHLANCLYLEWFSAGLGRIVIESAEFVVSISAPSWQPTAADEQQRQAEAAAGWREFLGQLDAGIERHQRPAKDHDAGWDEHDFERFLKESDARTDKYGELVEKYGDSEQAEELIAREMGWTRELTPEEAEEEAQRIAEINEACAEALEAEPEPPDPAREGIDWIRTSSGDLQHPLAHRALEAAVRFHKACTARGQDLEEDPDVGQFRFELQIASAKLAGALNSIAEGAPPEPAFTVAYLKRGLDHLHKSQAGLEAVAGKSRLPAELVSEARNELFAIREAVLQLMQQLRQQ